MFTEQAMRVVLEEVAGERFRQHGKWGEQHHGLPMWMAILMEEVGEAAKEVNEATSRLSRYPHAVESLRKLHVEMVQVAAVAAAILEDLNAHPDLPPLAWH